MCSEVEKTEWQRKSYIEGCQSALVANNSSGQEGGGWSRSSRQASRRLLERGTEQDSVNEARGWRIGIEQRIQRETPSSRTKDGSCPAKHTGKERKGGGACALEQAKKGSSIVLVGGESRGLRFAPRGGMQSSADDASWREAEAGSTTRDKQRGFGGNKASLANTAPLEFLGRMARRVVLANDYRMDVSEGEAGYMAIGERRPSRQASPI